MIAGQRRPSPAAEVLHVDYKDVLEQAVANERWRVIREIEEGLKRIETRKRGSSSYGYDDRSATDFKKDVQRLLDAQRHPNPTP